MFFFRRASFLALLAFSLLVPYSALAGKDDELIAASAIGNDDAVRELLAFASEGRYNAEQVIKDDVEWTAFHAACRGGHANVVKQLLEFASGHLELCSHFFLGGLKLAIEGDHRNVITEILKSPIRMKFQDDLFEVAHTELSDRNMRQFRQLMLRLWPTQANTFFEPSCGPLELEILNCNSDVVCEELSKDVCRELDCPLGDMLDSFDHFDRPKFESFLHALLDMRKKRVRELEQCRAYKVFQLILIDPEVRLEMETNDRKLEFLDKIIKAIKTRLQASQDGVAREIEDTVPRIRNLGNYGPDARVQFPDEETAMRTLRRWASLGQIPSWTLVPAGLRLFSTTYLGLLRAIFFLKHGHMPGCN